MKRHIVSIIFLLILSFWAIRPLLAEGFFPMHDDTQVGRVVVMGRALRNGQFPVRWVSDLGYGYGYPIFNFYGPLPYYFGGSLYSLGLSGVTAAKIMFLSGILLSGFTMYALIATLFGRVAGLASAVLYLYAPYHAVQVYVRGAVGEFWALSFLPLIVLGFILVGRKRTRNRGILISSLGLAGTILSHTLLGFLATLFVFTGLLAYWLRKIYTRVSDVKLFSSHVLAVCLGLGLSIFFWLPAILEMQFTSVGSQIGPTANYRDHFVCLAQFWNSPWGFGGSAPGCIDGLSFKLGKIHIIASIMGALALLFPRLLQRSSRGALTIGLGISLISLFLMLPWSLPVWESIKPFRYIQYPWRLLTIAVFGLSILSSGFFLLLGKKTAVRLLVGILVIGGTIAVNAKLFAPQYLYRQEPEIFEDVNELRFRVSKVSDEYLPKEFARPREPSDIALDTLPSVSGMTGELVVETETYRKFILVSDTSQSITLRVAHFPGWRYIRNGQEAEVSVVDGRPVISIPVGRTTLEMKFTDTPVRTVGNILSFISVSILAYAYGRKTVT